MSAYVVDRHHVIYLVKAAEAWNTQVLWRGRWYRLRNANDRLAVARTLWATNIASVCSFYNMRFDRPQLPGPIGESFRRIDHNDLNLYWPKFDPVQVLKSIACYEYQSCLLPNWELTLAATFCKHLHAHAITLLPGYDKAEWGAPLPFARIEEE